MGLLDNIKSAIQRRGGGSPSLSDQIQGSGIETTPVQNIQQSNPVQVADIVTNNAAQEQAPVTDTSILDGKGVPDNSVLYNEDFGNFVPEGGLSPTQMEMYKSRYAPVTGPLPSSTYYPDLGNNVAVGSYGGNQIGNLTLFAPGGGLVPLGVMDAREAAIQNVAMQKQKDMEEFQKLYGAAPKTRHTSVQGELDKVYYEGLQKWQQNALKKANGDQLLANKILNNDVNFQKWNQSAQTAAREEDTIVDVFAKIDEASKNKRFKVTPELKNQARRFASGYEGLGSSPFNKKGHDLNKEWAGLTAELDFVNLANEYMSDAVKQKLATAGVDPSNPDYFRLSETETEKFTDDTLLSMSKELAPMFPSMSEDQVFKKMKDMFGSVSEKKNVSITKKDKVEHATGTYDYNTDKSSQENLYNLKVAVTNKDGSVTNMADRQLSVNDVIALKKPITGNMPNGAHVYMGETGDQLNTEGISNVEYVIDKVGNMPVLSNNFAPVSKENIDSGTYTDKTGKEVKFNSKTSKILKVEPMVIGHVIKRLDNDPSKYTTETFYAPASEFKSKLTGKDGNRIIGVPLDEMSRDAEKRTSDLRGRFNEGSKKPYTQEQLEFARQKNPGVSDAELINALENR